MKGKLLLFSLAAALMLTLILVATAFAQRQGARDAPPPPPVSAAGEATINLGPITIKGHKVPLPVALQMVKAALKRPVNFRHENLGKLVCQFDGRWRKLDCHTNCQLWVGSMAFSGVYVGNQNCYGWRGPSLSSRMAVAVAGLVDHSRINRGALLRLLKKLPPTDSSYTLRITDHGKIVAEYVFKHGRLVKMWRAKSNKH